MSVEVRQRITSSSIGVLFEDDILYGCQASRTLIGRIRYQQASQPVREAGVEPAITELLSQFECPTSDTVVAAGIPTSETYFATRPIATSAGSVSPRILLRESLRSATARLDRLEIDVLHWQPDRRAVASIIAAPSLRIDSIRQALESAGFSLQQIEPVAASLCIAAARVDGKDKGNQTIVRVILSYTHALAIICKGSRPIHWHEMELPPGDETTGMVSVVRAVLTGATACGLHETPDRVVLHGRNELQPLVDTAWMAEQLQCELRWLEQPSADPAGMARALADNLLSGEPGHFDLARIHRAPTPFHQIIPYREVACYVGVAAVLFCTLWMRKNEHSAQHVALLSDAPVSLVDHAAAQTDQNQLTAKASGISRFLDNRIDWAPQLRTIVNHLPPQTRIVDLRGSANIRDKKKASKVAPPTLVLRGECALDPQGNVPPQLDDFVDQLRSDESLGSAFSHIELSDVRRTRSPLTGIDGVEFSIVMTSPNKTGR